MAWYGFRLFDLELREGNGRKPKEMSDLAGEHLGDHLQRLLERLRDGETLVGVPGAGAEEAAGDAEFAERHRNQPALRVERVSRHGGHMVRAEVLYGRYSDFSRGLRVPGSEEPDPELADIAPARSYRVIFALPATGTTGVLAIEDVSRTCPVKVLVRWLRQASQDDAAERAAAKYVDDEEAAQTAAAAAPWWKLAVHPMADVEHLRRLIEDGKLERVELLKKGASRDNTPSKSEMELTVRNLSPRKQALTAQLLEVWARRKWRDKADEDEDVTVTDADGAKALAALLGDDIAALDFDDGFVVVESGGKSKPISPSRLSDFFIYPIARDRQPLDLPFYEQARDTARRVARSTGTAGVEWPSIL